MGWCGSVGALAAAVDLGGRRQRSRGSSMPGTSCGWITAATTTRCQKRLAFGDQAVIASPSFFLMVDLLWMPREGRQPGFG